ncbi:MAG: hypothetical protein C5B49_15235 [Bdellovibrio sp.]|nr:MAG: hypothetical protein C5B49_15235 [Bdellovibrio sp.]
MTKSTRRSFTRRQFMGQSTAFLTHVAALPPTLAIPACRSLDRVFLGESRDDSERVTILGAGLAGLSAAYHLKRRQIPFQVFEATARPGGRLYHLPDFLPDQSVAELGAEFFSSEHKSVLELAKDLRLEIREEKPKKFFRAKNQLVPLDKLNIELRKLQHSKDANQGLLPEMPFDQWMNSATSDELLRELMAEWCRQRFGLEPDQISAAHWQMEMRKGPLGSAPRHRLANGTGLLAQALFERVSGYQSDLLFAFRHEWKALRLRPQGYELVFATPNGEERVLAKAVICAVPLAVLKGIDGIENLAGPWDQTDPFRMGNHSRLLLSYKQRFWAKPLREGELHLLAPGQTLWESSFQLNTLAPLRRGLLTLQWGGEGAKQAGPESLTDCQKELAKIFPAAREAELMDQEVMNWGLRPLAQGSISAPWSGLQTFRWKSDQVNWQWAGEHTSEKWRGSLEGALESGNQAVLRIARERNQR